MAPKTMALISTLRQTMRGVSGQFIDLSGSRVRNA